MEKRNRRQLPSVAELQTPAPGSERLPTITTLPTPRQERQSQNVRRRHDTVGARHAPAPGSTGRVPTWALVTIPKLELGNHHSTTVTWERMPSRCCLYLPSGSHLSHYVAQCESTWLKCRDESVLERQNDRQLRYMNLMIEHARLYVVIPPHR